MGRSCSPPLFQLLTILFLAKWQRNLLCLLFLSYESWGVCVCTRKLQKPCASNHQLPMWHCICLWFDVDENSTGNQHWFNITKAGLMLTHCLRRSPTLKQHWLTSCVVLRMHGVLPVLEWLSLFQFSWSRGREVLLDYKYWSVIC